MLGPTRLSGMLTDCDKWSQQVFGGAELGDQRRTRRLVEMAARAAERPSGRISQAFDTTTDREGAYDFIENSLVPTEQIGVAAFRATAREAAEFKLVFIPIDGTSIKLWDGVGHKDFGRIGTHAAGATGLKVINALAIDSSGVPIGLCGQHWWSRPRRKVKKRDRKLRRTGEKETRHWTRVIRESHAILQEQAPQTRCWFQLDREGDAWPLLLELIDTGAWFTVRSCSDRRIHSTGRQRYLRETLRKQRIRCIYDIDVPERKASKEHEHRKARRARMTARTATVSLELKDKRTRRIFVVTLNALLIREQGTTPRGENPLEWMLLTNRPLQNKKCIKQTILGYTMRWRIEDVHKSWKTGYCNVEDTQLHSSEAVIRWATILAVVATRVERLKHKARTSPEEPATVELSRDEISALVLMKRRRKRPGETIPDNPTIGEATLWIGELGGYTGKSSGGPPGSITIGRGLQRLLSAAEVVTLMKQLNK
jgi:hypothetical protein